jgi:plasmid stabilization system protein ParE
MTYRVIFQRLAVQDLDDAFVWAAQKAPATAARWFDRFQAALQRLDTNPQRCRRAREQRKVDIDLREILFGKTPNVFRVIFMIDGDTVRVLRIRRAQRRPLTRKQIDEASEQDKPELDR